MDDSTLTRDRKIHFIALGGVWLDEVRRIGLPAAKDIVGGSVAFATLGARLFSESAPQRVQLVFRAGNDFPQQVLEVFRSWNVGLTVRIENASPSARGIVHYSGKDGSDRVYERLTSPLLTTPEQDLTIEQLANAECFHFFTTPDMIDEQLDLIYNIRRAMMDVHGDQRPLIIWEPQAKSCKPDTREQHTKAFSRIDVFSPNHVELCSLYSESKTLIVDRDKIESTAMAFYSASLGHARDRNHRKSALIVRAAEHGCYVLCFAGGKPSAVWLPAYHGADSGKVIDPTGAGNAFLGAIAIGFRETGDFVQAAAYGQVAASFVIEQVGMPNLSGEAEHETWNGVGVRDRLAAYRQRLQHEASS